MIFGEAFLFICLSVTCAFFAAQLRSYSWGKGGIQVLTAGLALIALASLIDLLVIGPDNLLPFTISGEKIVEFWQIFGYLPGILLVMLGMAKFLPAIGRMNEEVAAREETEHRLRAQTKDLQQATAQAETAEKILVEALEAISDAFIIFDSNDRVLAFNSRYRELFGDVGDALKPGVTFEELIRTQAENANHFKNEADQEKWIDTRLDEHHNPHGSKVQIFEGGRVFRLTECKTSSGGIIAIRTDITDLRAREEALVQLNDRLNEAQSVAHIGHWSFDLKRDIHNWSDETSRIMGYNPDTINITASAYLSRVHPDDLERMRSTVKQAQENEEDYQIEYRIVRPNADVVYVREIGRVQKNITGDVEFFRGTVQDITKEYFVGLELIEAKIKAEEGTKAKSLFLANMSHELRTPLNAVIGFAEVITKEIFGPINNDKYKEYSENILSSGQHLLSLINDILDYSRLEAGKYELEEQEVSYRDVSQWSELMLAPKAQEKSIDLKFDLTKEFIFMGDERKIKQVMVNLVNNAIKFTPNGGWVKVYSNDEAQDHVSIFVEDNGIGIGEEELEAVLRPFVRTVSSISRSVEGTGLGLPLSKSIVELHGGKLVINSEPQKGTIIEIQLPRSRFTNWADILEEST